ncbi:MAG: M18 family aminopeptidase [Sulfurimonadaceae bacterium]|jgi:aspartyl aminopeptidase|nr:M18 family aminopeptidase [Sulfurimonadaceae bacterium]
MDSKMTKEEFNEGLMGFVDFSPTPFHVTKNICSMLENGGFIRLYEEQRWELKRGEKYYVTRNDSSVIAFTYPEANNFTMIGAHTDSPNLKLKPNPIIKEHGVVKFAVEPYGGVLLNPWFDRDLSLAGRVSYLSTGNVIKEALIDVKKPIAIIPSLAIHLDREANNSKSINAQTDITPVISCKEDFDFKTFLEEQLVSSGIEDVHELYANELSLYDTQKASYIGINDEFIASARLDNLLSCYVGLLAIASAEADTPILFIASDHEEVGSESTSGAGGSFLENTLRRMYPDYEEYMQMVRTSMLISADNAHAIHPNFPTKHDTNHAPYINKGVVVKVNSNQRYASNARTISRFMNVASAIEEPLQQFVTRSDMGCGSTIGPITSARLGIDTLDIGLPTYGMHSIREVCGTDDAYSLFKIFLELSRT